MVKVKKVTAAVLLLTLLVWTAAIATGCGKEDQGGMDTLQNQSSQEQEPSDPTDTAEPGDQGQEMPSFENFTALDLQGNDVDESLWAGHKLTMVNVWGTFCSPCIEEMPDLGQLNRELEEEGVQVVGIVSDIIDSELAVSPEGLELAREIVEATKADYVHLVPSIDLLYAGIASVEAVPTTFFLNEQGTLVGKVYSGKKSKEKWEGIIEETLKEVEDAGQK